ncbi:hypothetical protein J2W21_000646 [Sinomonas atrocyanea]|uniref:hypothetical protein n=1 Tax=Sinomonas atrocyanea TaxID=37927 RepID=UPI00278405B8|nr:hypothetical protein [Sinomonas atrocyanea]MDP9883156.1 hypothetical protein [Sinomonas atrocyanea]
MEDYDRRMYRTMIADAASGLLTGTTLSLAVRRLGGWTENGWWEAVISRPEDIEDLIAGVLIDGAHLTFDDRAELTAWLSSIGATPAEPIPLHWEDLAGFTCAVALQRDHGPDLQLP